MSCQSEKARPRGRRKYAGRERNHMRPDSLKQRMEAGLRGHFSGLCGALQALTSWIRRDKEGEGTVNGSNSDSLPISFSISALPRAKSKNYGIHQPGSQQNLQG